MEANERLCDECGAPWCGHCPGGIVCLTAQLAESNRLREEIQRCYDRDTAKLQQEIERLSAANAGVYWRWQGDGGDYLESLTCPILIDVGQLHEIFSVNAAATARAEVAEAFIQKIPDYRRWIKEVIAELGDQEASDIRPHTHVDFVEQIHGLARIDLALAALLAPAKEEPKPVKLPHPDLAYKAVVARSEQIEKEPT